MKILQKMMLAFLIITTVEATAQTSNSAMKNFIDVLMKKMTLDEKIGQLNLPGSGDIVTGQAGNSKFIVSPVDCEFSHFNMTDETIFKAFFFNPVELEIECKHM